MIKSIKYTKNRFDFLITETDGENLQAKIAASMSHDTNLCKLFASGGDFHTSNTYHILAKYQLFDEVTFSFSNGQEEKGMEYQSVKNAFRGNKELSDVFYGDIEKGDVINGVEVTSITKNSRHISYEEYCKNAKKGKCKHLRDVGKAIGLSFIFGAGVNNLAGGTLRRVWTPKTCEEFIKERKLEDLRKSAMLYNSHLKDDDLSYYVVAAFFRSEFFKLYPELENWINECSKEASIVGYRRTPWGSRRLLPQLTYKGKDSDGGSVKNLCNIAVNSPVQDYETVVMATAMIKIDTELERLGYESYIMGTVHDSCVCVVKKDEADAVLKICLDAFRFSHPATFGVQYSGECDIADYSKGEFWGYGGKSVKWGDVKDNEIIKKYKKR